MDREELLYRQHNVLNCLSCLPKKILSLYDRENVSEFVLYDLCHESCFNLQKAAYFVNNPDFNCLKGVTGIAQKEIPELLWNDIWEKAEIFSTYMRNALFNKMVRDWNQCSLEDCGSLTDKTIECVLGKLEMDKPLLYSVPMKHGNIGLFICEKNDQENSILDECITNGLSLLGFCPVF